MAAGAAKDSPPLLLCNGIGAPIEMWSPFRDPLGRPTIAFDAPGVGESSVPLIPPTMSGVARIVLGVLDHLGVPTVDVLGVSWGGALAQEVARRGGERVRRLVLCATMAGGAPIPGDPRVLAILATPLRYWSPSYLDRVAPRLYGPDVAGNPEMMAHQRRARFTRAPSTRGYLGQVLALRRFASVLWLHRLRQPTLVLTGESDPIVQKNYDLNEAFFRTLLEGSRPLRPYFCGFAAPPGAPSPGSSGAWGPCPTPGRHPGRAKRTWATDGPAANSTQS